MFPPPTNIRASRFPLQRFIRSLPEPLHRIKVAQWLASITASPYQRMTFRQGELVGNVRDVGFANCLVSGGFADYGYFELARHLLARGDVHVDVGANYGFHTFGLLQSPLGPSLKYVLVEANPDCAACLAASARLHPEVPLQVFHAAAAEQAGNLRFTFSPRECGAGHVGAAAGPGGVEITVPATPLGPLFEENGAARIGLMKMDIEGSEPAALRSLSAMLAEHRINFVYFEVNPECLEQQQSDPAALFAEFTRHGYQLFWPHADEDFILLTYGRNNAAASDLQRCTVFGSQPHDVVRFDRSHYRKGEFKQCDLLAVSPGCRVEEKPLNAQAAFTPSPGTAPATAPAPPGFPPASRPG